MKSLTPLYSLHQKVALHTNMLAGEGLDTNIAFPITAQIGIKIDRTLDTVRCIINFRI
jgi:hypothetical protein